MRKLNKHGGLLMKRLMVIVAMVLTQSLSIACSSTSTKKDKDNLNPNQVQGQRTIAERMTDRNFKQN